jgi:two-component system chemotaxis sensor kinase CheA
MSSKNQDIKARLLGTFKIEAQEHLDVLAANLLTLHGGVLPKQVPELIEATFREIHTLKGAARSVSLRNVENLCQAGESLLSKISHGSLMVNRAILDALSDAIGDLTLLVSEDEASVNLAEIIERLDTVGTDTVPESSELVGRSVSSMKKGAGATLKPQTTDSIRLTTAKLDVLLLQVEDLVVPKLANEERLREAGTLVEGLSQCRSQWNRLREDRRLNGSTTDASGLATDVDLALRTIEGNARQLQGRLTRDHQAITGIVDGLLDEMRRVRMTTAASVLGLFPPMVLDLAQELEKDVDCLVLGADLEIDRKVLEAIKDPLIHLVRNAVDHGIEAPAARLKAGKPSRGRVTVSVAAMEGNRIEIRVEDDGWGLNRALVKAAGVRARLLTAETAEALTEEQVLELIYRSGFSTSPIITDLSGHGLGLAIVKERVEGLGGWLEVESRPGAGMTVRMILPASIATFHGILIRAGGQPFLIPAEAVERAMRVPRDAIERVEDREVIRRNGQPVSIARLSQVLGLPEHDGHSALAGPHSVVIVRVGEELAALIVEEVLGDREVLVKELRPPLVRVRNIAGAALLGTRQVVLILRATDLLQSLRTVRPVFAPPAVRDIKEEERTVLVVDDSITTRTMEKNLLEAAGYRVKVAVDGLDAWTVLKSENIDLVLSDVDMPRMDGLDLTARIRADPRLAQLPVILVTALESREDKERGIEVGANAYFVKSSFDQTNLLEILRRFI